ncbi:hypothetical protein N7520_009157 [Penicillium odoratum]|uniref:uncharacterized protein n=1 Tax=Penicillium odoratum TaxID=1167516 RepID=UPI00254767A5|nr:uncharacterized protein N7520_009157 [Penicillium odoratum]KAJ5752240.1 hypothetical protein N7520_009157 [Penicillium odoratum]
MGGNKTELITLIKNGREINTIKDLLNKGANVNAQDSDGQTAMMIATSHGYHEVVSLLLKYKAKTDTTHKGQTALFIAAQKGDENIAKLLLLNGADPKGPNMRGKSALSQAVISGNLSMTRLLLNYGATTNVLCANGDTALTYAVVSDNIEMTQLLLDHGTPVDQIGISTRTSLFRAVSLGNVRMAKLLIEKGADPNRQDNQGLSAMRIAMENRQDEILRLFYQFGYGYQQPGIGIGRTVTAMAALDILGA